MARRRKRQRLSFELPLLPRRRGILFPNSGHQISLVRKRNANGCQEVSMGVRRELPFVLPGDMTEVLKAALSETALVHPAPQWT